MQIFIDSNVILEAKPLHELPWSELGASEQISILLVPQVLKEVDSKKRDGRLAVRARDFNRRMGEALDKNGTLYLSQENPRVEISFATCHKIDWGKYDDLDPNEGDARVVAEILNCRDIDLASCVLTSQDIAPLILAKRYGVKIWRLPEHWMGLPEPSPQEKEIAKLKKQIAEHSRNEPEFQVSVRVPAKPKVFKVLPLETQDQHELLLQIQAKNPRREQRASGRLPGLSLEYDSTYNGRYDEYISETLPNFIENISRKLELMYGQVPVEFALENVGKVRADHLHVEIQVVNGWLNDKPIISGRYPLAPTPDPYRAIPPLNIFNRYSQVGQKVGRHEVELSSFSRSESLMVQCADFRQGQKWELNAVLFLDPNATDPTKIIVTITAANLHGQKSTVEVVRKEVNSTTPFELIDKSTGEHKVQPNIQEKIVQVLSEGRYSDLDFNSD